MKILILGQGGREHALVKAFKNSPLVTEVHVIPGNDGMKKEAICHNVSTLDTEKIVQLCVQSEIDFVFIGPEDPLVAGISDKLRERGILVVGPSQQAAQLEGSKVFAKEFMMEAKVPTAPYFVVTTVEDTLQKATHFNPPYVLKADGLTAGKGVFICKTLADLKEASESLFIKQIFGEAGKKALLEKFEPGWELSFIVLTNGENFVSLPLAQDHKRLSDNNEGPNTGGMGTVAPLNIPDNLKKQIEDLIIAPSVANLKARQFLFRGALFVGVMVTAEGPKVLEYNVRLGDPETQVILPLIDDDLAQIMMHLSQGKLETIQFKKIHSACVILASPGYPDSPIKGITINGLNDNSESSTSYAVHAGTKLENNTWKTNGGRVIGAVGIGNSKEEALKQAYELNEKINWDGKLFRKDIGKYLPTI
jgi:phosphoribosylamine--glycine ligase